MFEMILGYRRPYGKRWGKINYGNGFMLRAGPVALHIWKPRGLNLTEPTREYVRRAAPKTMGRQ